jgi:hypothetical protein
VALGQTRGRHSDQSRRRDGDRRADRGRALQLPAWPAPSICRVRQPEVLYPHHENDIVPVVPQKPDDYRTLAVALHAGHRFADVEWHAYPAHRYRVGNPGREAFHPSIWACPASAGPLLRRRARPRLARLGPEQPTTRDGAVFARAALRAWPAYSMRTSLASRSPRDWRGQNGAFHSTISTL